MRHNKFLACLACFVLFSCSSASERENTNPLTETNGSDVEADSSSEADGFLGKEMEEVSEETTNCQPADCDDNLVCTKDTCEDGVCTHEVALGCVEPECLIDTNCDQLETTCTIDLCKSTFVCEFHRDNDCEPVGCSEDLECGDADDCTIDVCDDGECRHFDLPNCPLEGCVYDNDCIDADHCTEDLCVDGQCVNQVAEICADDCQSDEDCEDADPCSDTFCKSNGGCVIILNFDKEGCEPGCVSDADCPHDDNPCTEEICQDNKCVQETVENCCSDTSDCEEDGDQCTNEVCQNFECVSVKNGTCCSYDADCDDGNDCTFESCNTDGSCNNPAILAKPNCCETIDNCGAWLGYTTSCQDHYCTWVADPTKTCASDADCDDGNPATEDFCYGNGEPLCANIVDPICKNYADCDDGDPCTSEICIVFSNEAECVIFPIDNCCKIDEDCVPDDDPCTNEVCQNFECVKVTVDDCCKVDGNCDDGNPCTYDVCTVANTCMTIQVIGCVNCAIDSDCDDKDECTKDTCHPDGICIFEDLCLYGFVDTKKQCFSQDDCLGTTFGDFCTYSQGNGFSMCQPCSQGDGWSIPDQGCEEGETCYWGLTGIEDGEYASTYWCAECSGDFECDDGDPLSTDTCINDQCQHIAISCEDIEATNTLPDGVLLPGKHKIASWKITSIEGNSFSVYYQTTIGVVITDWEIRDENDIVLSVASDDDDDGIVTFWLLYNLEPEVINVYATIQQMTENSILSSWIVTCTDTINGPVFGSY